MTAQHDAERLPRRSPDALGLNTEAARALAGALAEEGAAVFLSPGSRSTPLALAFDELARERRDVGLHVLIDERVAAFAALGASRASTRAAVLVCTSGTAGGHYLPAVMEAHMSRVPLIVITADRPPEQHHCGAPQTIAQGALFGGYARFSATLATPSLCGDPERDLRWFAAMGRRARLVASGSPAGPVHLDAPFRKPLHDDPPAELARSRMKLVTGERRILRGRLELAGDDLSALAGRLAAVSRGVIYCGPLAPAVLDGAALADAAVALAEALG